MAWDRLSPVASSALASAPLRANFQAIDLSNLAPNWVQDPFFVIWAAGDAVVPSHYNALQGAGLAVARDTTNHRTNSMACKLTLGSADGYLPQTLFPAGELPILYRGMDVSFGCFIKTSTALLAKVGLYDGVGTAFSGLHTGGGGWEWLAGTRTLAGAATELELRLQVDIAGTAGNATFDLPTVVPGSIPPQNFLPCPILEGAMIFPVPAAVATATNKGRFIMGQPFLVRNVTLRADTAPTGAGLIVDVNHWDGSAQQSMFSTKPTIAATAKNGGLNPDGTYRYRCFGGQKNAESDTDALLTIDIDQVGSTVSGSDLDILIRAIQFGSPLGMMRSF